jgi:hypothetical protein
VILPLIAAVASLAGATAPAATFTDPTGDSGSAPDITSVGVTNDDHGQYTFTIDFATPTPFPSTNDGVFVYLDTDQNAATGASGFDYALGLVEGQSGLLQWNASSDAYEVAAQQSSVDISFGQMSIVMTVNASDIGNVGTFKMAVVSIHVEDSGSSVDSTTEQTYTSQTIFTLLPVSVHQTAAKDGGTWTVSTRVIRSDTGQPVGVPGAIKCSATEGSKKLAVVRGAFDGTTGTCTFRVPKKPSHARVYATVVVSSAGQLATENFTAKTK